MNRARKELLDAESSSSSVTDIATSLGLTELGRFAVDYKRLFGESPSATLSHGLVVPDRRMWDLLPEAPDR